MWSGHSDALEEHAAIWLNFRTATGAHKHVFVKEIEVGGMQTLHKRHVKGNLNDHFFRRVRSGVIAVDHELIWNEDQSVVACRWWLSVVPCCGHFFTTTS